MNASDTRPHARPGEAPGEHIAGMRPGPQDEAGARAALASAFLGVSAARLGMSVEDMARRHPLPPGVAPGAWPPADDPGLVDLLGTATRLAAADPAIFLRKCGRFFLAATIGIAARPDAPAGIRKDTDRVLRWFGMKDLDAWQALSPQQQSPHHARIAGGLRAWLEEGGAPAPALAGPFARIRAWMRGICHSLTGLGVHLSPQVSAVFDGMRVGDADPGPRRHGVQARAPAPPAGPTTPSRQHRMNRDDLHPRGPAPARAAGPVPTRQHPPLQRGPRLSP